MQYMFKQIQTLCLIMLVNIVTELFETLLKLFIYQKLADSAFSGLISIEYFSPLFFYVLSSEPSFPPQKRKNNH